jgi:hypothetical protein
MRTSVLNDIVTGMLAIENVRICVDNIEIRARSVWFVREGFGEAGCKHRWTQDFA